MTLHFFFFKLYVQSHCILALHISVYTHTYDIISAEFYIILICCELLFSSTKLAISKLLYVAKIAHKIYSHNNQSFHIAVHNLNYNSLTIVKRVSV